MITKYQVLETCNEVCRPIPKETGLVCQHLERMGCSHRIRSVPAYHPGTAAERKHWYFPRKSVWPSTHSWLSNVIVRKFAHNYRIFFLNRKNFS